MERLLRDEDIEADQSKRETICSEDSDAGGVEIQDYLPETVLSMSKLDPSSNISDGDSDASMGGGQATEDSDQDQEIHTALSGKLILYACFIFSVGLNIKAINILYAADKDLDLQDLGSTSHSFCSIDDLSAVYHLSIYFQHLFIIIYQCSFFIHL